ncbi:hypothetical protein BTN92_13815 [Enterococcus mundtii]|uniref:Uncharacterized protein n=1 Tax=Enterococcus mundtii TaxID=53346 RepID=A0A1V2UCY1_ENTMU|nr:hypothetical protein BTN92_13815 [Enterococcus mundtii]
MQSRKREPIYKQKNNKWIYLLILLLAGFSLVYLSGKLSREDTKSDNKTTSSTTNNLRYDINIENKVDKYFE